MEDLKPSRWDTSLFPHSDRFDPTTFTSLPTSSRVERRTQVFEHAHRNREPDWCRVAGEEYTRRAQLFRAYADDVALNVSYRAWPGSRSRLPLLSGWGISLTLLIASAVVLALFQLGGSGWLVLPIFLVLPSLGTWRGWRTSRGFDRALNEDRCCDCGYPLADVPPGLPVDLAGVNVGPRACPECGAAWPLVPAGI